jgi:virulence-associated protein VagC
MSAVFHTRQFKTGSSQAIGLPSKLAYPLKTDLAITRIGEKTIIEPTAENAGSIR